MADPPQPTAPVFPLGSMIKLQNGDDLTRIAPSIIDGLPSRTTVGMRTTTDAKLPLSDQTLTGKQEHCEWALPKPHDHRESLTVPRSQARTHLAAGHVRNHRLSIYNGVTAVWRTISIRIWRGSTGRFRSPITSLYIRSSCPKLSVFGPGKGKGVLARQIASGEGNFWASLRDPSLI